MRAARLYPDGEGVRLLVHRTERPEPGPGEVLIEVHAVGVNQLERQVIAGARVGRPAALPRTVGLDPAGVIVAQGPEVAGKRVGERVAVKPNIPCGDCPRCRDGREADCLRQEVVGVHRDGGAAGYVAVPARAAFPLPGDLAFPAAAAAVHSVPIALHMIRRAGGVRPGQTVLITGAAGALGCAALQVAAALGGTVLAGVLAGEPSGELPGLGAAAVLPYEADDPADRLVKQVAEHAPGGVPVAVDASGSGELIGAALRCLAWSGSAVFAAALPESRIGIDTRDFYARRLTLYGCAAADDADVRDGLAMAGDGRVRPPVAAEFGLGAIEEAYAMVARRDHLGKVILRPGEGGDDR